jgi:hypothetical protein
LFVIFLFTIISCKSTPAQGSTGSTGTAGQTTGQTTQPGQQVPRDIMNRVEEARKRAIDFECPQYFPSEWDAIETRYAAAQQTQQSAEEFNAIADAYDDLFRKTIPLYAQAREDEIMSTRSELISTGFTNLFPEYLRKTDEIALTAKAEYESKDYYKARDTASKALNEYETLLAGARVYLARKEIIDYGFAVHDPDNFNKADEEGQIALNEYKAGNKETALAKANEAMRLYNIVLENGWRTTIAELRAAAIAERELALKEKANIASRDLFQGADSVFNQAERYNSSRNYRNAGISYIESKEQFTASRHDTEAKRLRALDAIRLAEEKIEESNEAAIGAERIIEGGLR